MAHDLRDVGGTRGGFGMFVVGLGMTIAGLYLLFRQVDVHGGYWRWGGGDDRSFGLTLLPLLAGVGVLFWNGSSKLGWGLAGGGLLILVIGIIANMRIHLRSMSLFDTLIILVLVAGGLGVIARSLRAVGGDGDGTPKPPPS
ncbi:MAG: hypothetical protein JNK64_26125 [Myxococcales bacterium]|nr:hypothetical protein [Myxococcales bacterium]